MCNTFVTGADHKEEGASAEERLIGNDGDDDDHDDDDNDDDDDDDNENDDDSDSDDDDDGDARDGGDDYLVIGFLLAAHDAREHTELTPDLLESNGYDVRE